jgi:hypothetical protein
MVIAAHDATAPLRGHAALRKQGVSPARDLRLVDDSPDASLGTSQMTRAISLTDWAAG